MTDEAAMPPPPAYPTFEEVEHSVYGFDCDKWEDIPYPDGPDWFTDSERSRRNELANRYQKHGGTPTGWARYLELGFFGYEDCSEFEDVWNNFDVKPLEVHKAIWYQFMYHLDREFEIPEKLQEWSTNYSHIYVAYYDPASLQVDTYAPLKEWKILNDRDTTMDDEERNTNEGWIDVPERGRRRDKSPPKEQETKKLHSDIPARQAIKELHNQLKQSKRYQKTMKPASKLPQVSTVHEEDEEDYQMEDNNSHESTTEKWSDALPRLKPFQNVPVNDGTHRLTVRWKPLGGIQQYENDKQTLNQAIHMLLSAVLDDADGMLYRWESKDLKTFSPISKLTGTELRDYISPQISFIKPTSQIIFGVRLSFTENPVKWQHSPGKKQQLKDNQVEIKVSNSSSTGGKPVIAGYILLKAPNTTSTHRYTQYIRSLMPEATPYFDIERYKKTPMGQVIPHLVVQCGERHVTPVCQALLHVLSGKGTAVFLPRYVFSAMTDDQINNQFLFHEKWLHSVKALHLAPVIFHLDQQRIEYCDDGSIIKRSTREWAGTLTLPDKSSALCDVVNGTKERKAYLLVPAHYFDQAKEELRLYRLRLSPPSHREARFRDSVLDLPDEIHIKTAADSNVSFMDTLSTADVWQKLPTYLGKPHSSSLVGKDKKKNISTQFPTKQLKNAWTTPPAQSDQNLSDKAKEHQQVSEDDSLSLEGRLSVGTDDLSTASTQSLTLASDSKYQTKLKELEVATKKKLESLQIAGRAASKQLESLEEKFQTFATDTSKKIEEVQSELQQVVKQLEESVDTQGKISGSLSAIQVNTATQFEQIGEHLVASGENVSILTSSMTDIREELARLFGLMAQDIAVRNASQAHQTPLTLIPGGTLGTNMRPSGYHTSDLTTGSSAEGMIRSPPPKRTREGVTLLHTHSEQDDASMLFDQSEESLVLGDMTIDDDNEDDVENETYHAEVEYDFSSQEEVCVDLKNRFDATETDDIHSDNYTLTQSPTPDAVTPRFTNTNTRSIVHDDSKQSSCTPPAPLDPQYTFETGPAGAADS